MRHLVDRAGTITDTYVNDAFGNERAATGSTPNTFRFGGKYGYQRDAATRLYVRARHLDTARGTWLTRDPIGFWGGDVNLGRYVGNNPVNRLDPSGKSWQAALGGCAVGGFIGFLGSWISDGTACQNTCNAALGCVIGGLVGLLIEQLPQGADKWAGCAVGATSAATGAVAQSPVGAACNTICNLLQPNSCPPNASPAGALECALEAAAVSIVFACVVGALGASPVVDALLATQAASFQSGCTNVRNVPGWR